MSAQEFLQAPVEGFKKLPTAGKIAVGGIALLVVYAAYRAYRSRASSAATSAVSANASPDAGTPGSNIYGTLGGQPIIPPGYSPITDSSGGVIGWQPPSSPTPGQPSNPVVGKTAGKDYPLVPYDQYTGPSYSHLAPGTVWTYQGTPYTLSTGASGRLYGTYGGVTTYLHGPKSAYPAS